MTNKYLTVFTLEGKQYRFTFNTIEQQDAHTGLLWDGELMEAIENLDYDLI